MGATSVVVSTQHVEDLEQAEIKRMLWPIVKSTLPDGWMCPEAEFHVNPTGKFVIGGPDGDCGLTGRKIIVDTYGGAAPHGGGAFSGKDPTKVDRSRRLCLPLSGEERRGGRAGGPLHHPDQLRDRHLAAAVGLCRPARTPARTWTRRGSRSVLRELMNLSPRGIREHLHLNRPIYVPTSAYGHFGREPDEEKGTFTWEKTDLVPALKVTPSGAEAAAGPAVRPRPRPPAAAAAAAPARGHAAAPARSRRSRRPIRWRPSRRAPAQLWLEVGFGGGEHALAQIAAHPEAGLIACEVFDNGICSLLSRLVPEGGEATAPLPGQSAPLDRAMRGRCCGCCRTAASIGCSCCSRIPGRRARHAKRRFVHPALLPLLARVAAAGRGMARRERRSDLPGLGDEVMAEQTLFDVPRPPPHGRRLAADPLRGEGAARGPRPALLVVHPHRDRLNHGARTRPVRPAATTAKRSPTPRGRAAT